MTETLYCPRCASKFIGETLFCRTCGLALEGVREIVDGNEDTAPVIVRRPNFAAFRFGIGLFIIGLVIGLLNGALKDLGIFPYAYGKVIFYAFIAAGLLSFGAAVAFPTKKYTQKKYGKQKSEQAPQLNTAPLAAELASSIPDDIDFPERERVVVEPRSVTEHTTRNLN